VSMLQNTAMGPSMGKIVRQEDYAEYENVEATRGPRVHAKRGGPRSKLVEAIAVLLLAKPMRAAEIAEILGYSTRYISSYLSYWRTRGLFEYENGFWVLTEEGEEYARTIAEREMNTRLSQYAALAQRILQSSQLQPTQISLTRNNKTHARRGAVSGKKLPFLADNKGKADSERQRSVARACATALLADLEELSSDEQTVLEALLDHYVKWGSTYTYIDHLEKQLEADRAWLLGVLRMLQSKKLVYIYTDRRLGIRVGLAKRLRELLESCSGATS